MKLVPDGWLTPCRRVESPNQDERPAGEAVTLLVVHSISLPPGQYGGDAIERLFTNRLDPAAHPYSWRGRERCNDFSIGVELEGTDSAPFESAQYERLTALVHALRAHHPLRELAAHSDIAPGRKTDPGPGFDWPRLYAALSRFHIPADH